MPISCNFKNTAFCTLLATILTVNLLRFFNLENAPKGFYIDEIASAVNAHSIASEGCDYTGKKWPLFGNPGLGSLLPPTQIYPMALWIKIFGISIGSVRAFSAFVYTLSLIGIFLLARLWGGSSCAWLTLLASSLSPWGWMYSRTAFEDVLAPTFLIWGVFCFVRDTRWWTMPLAGLFLSCSMYSYVPMRLFIPIVILLLIGYHFRQNKFQQRSLGIFIITLTLLSIPLVYGTFHDGLYMQRFSGLSILSKNSSWTSIAVTFTHNYFLHLTPQYLFLTGDNNFRHSTRHFGELSWIDAMGLGAGLVFLIILFQKRKRPSPIVVFLLLAAAAGIIPAALTNEGLPHALRTIGSHPFLELLVGYSLAKAVARWPGLLLIISLTGIIFAAVFFNVYFRIYPDESADAFMSEVKVDAQNCRTQQDWLKFFLHYGDDRIIFRYYIIRYYPKALPASFF